MNTARWGLVAGALAIAMALPATPAAAGVIGNYEIPLPKPPPIVLEDCKLLEVFCNFLEAIVAGTNTTVDGLW
jgi:hypothetical protein